MGDRIARTVVIVLLMLAGIAPGALPAVAAPSATYEVGPGRTYASLSQVADLLNPGDVVLVYGNGTTPYAETVIFDRPGTSASPIIIRGVAVNGRRPILSSAGSITVEFRADHYVFEGFEATGTGDNHRVLYHHADNIVIRDTLIRDCPRNGILGADTDSGSLLLEYVEITNCGNGTFHHGIYMATGLPGAVFRMQFCYLHDLKGGNAVKSRANRNEIYYNWIEGAYYHELELIGPDDGTGGTPESPREDSDVVGNVLIKRSDFGALIRIGGDGTGQSWGRYRFVNNTLIMRDDGDTVFRTFDGLESLEFHNNILMSAEGGGVNVIRTVEAVWRDERAVSGTNNWIQSGSIIPPELQQTIQGADPQFIHLTDDLRPRAASPLIDAGAAAPASPAEHPFPNPLAPPTAHPPMGRALPAGTLPPRPSDGAIDIGAYEVLPFTGGDQLFLPALYGGTVRE